MKKKAFTLIEMLVVIAIIGILATLILPALQKARASANRASSNSNMSNIIKGIIIQTNLDSRNKFRGIWAGNALAAEAVVGIISTGLNTLPRVTGVANAAYTSTTAPSGAGGNRDVLAVHILGAAASRVTTYYAGENNDALRLPSGHQLEIFSDFHGKHPFDAETGYYGFRGTYTATIDGHLQYEAKKKGGTDVRIIGEFFKADGSDGAGAIGFADGHVQTIPGHGPRYIQVGSGTGVTYQEFTDTFNRKYTSFNLLDINSNFGDSTIDSGATPSNTGTKAGGSGSLSAASLDAIFAADLANL